MTGETFIITRPEEDARRFLQAARKAGARAIAMPVIGIHFLDDAAIPQWRWQAVAITSANGARAIARRADAARLTRALAVTVGPASTRAALQAGFLHVLQAARNDVQGVIEVIIARLKPVDGPLLYASGAVTRGDLQGALEEAGFEVARAVLYEARPAAALNEEARRALAGERPGTVALYSPRSARIWARLVKEAGLAQRAARWRHACLSQNVAMALREDLPEAAGCIAVSPAPREEAMLSMLGLG